MDTWVLEDALEGSLGRKSASVVAARTNAMLTASRASDLLKPCRCSITPSQSSVKGSRRPSSLRFEDGTLNKIKLNKVLGFRCHFTEQGWLEGG